MFSRTAAFVALGVVVVLPAVSANAADLLEPYPEVAAPAPSPDDFDWVGAYAGIHGGYGESNFDGAFDLGELDDGFPDGSETTFLDDLDAGGALGGLQAGFNLQRGNFVFGIEGDVSFTDMSGEVADGAGDDLVEADLDLLASFRARLGLAHNRLLGYVTGGLGYAHGQFEVIDNLGEGDENHGTVDIDSVGGVAGGGFEWAATDRVSFRVEGLYYFFNDDTDTSGVTDDSDPGDFLSLDNAWVVRGGINFLFM